MEGGGYGRWGLGIFLSEHSMAHIQKTSLQFPGQLHMHVACKDGLEGFAGPLSGWCMAVLLSWSV